METSVFDILTELGYSLISDNNGWRTSRLYADGDNKTSLKIFENGNWYDFVENRGGNLSDLVKVTLNLSSRDYADNWLKNKKWSPQSVNFVYEKIKMKKTYDKANLEKLIPDHSYWQDRGISEKIVSKYNGGISRVGGTKDRYVFPILDFEDDLVGFAARDLTGKKANKWKLFGDKITWVFPISNDKEIRKLGQIYLVESIGDMLALEEVGINNTICLFGTSMNLAVLNYCIRTNPSQIIIALNNDSALGTCAGNNAALAIQNKLQRYFDFSSILVHFPGDTKDWNDQLIKNGPDRSRWCISM